MSWFSGLLAPGWFSPRSNRMLPADRRFTFSSTMRMVTGIHSHPSNRWPAPQMPQPACLTQNNILGVDITNLTDSRPTRNMHHALLTRGQLDDSVVPFFSH